ncbi:efflux RND transporter periplasmic adaptor subunit [Chthoniobacter flavus]|uniref:hypothetical protein n=1 Tax=Chthoniobacter flavus TaxID=191863 RepID=UPI000678E798|nr:hypothetical protein [Chthoniobacter flavus]
MTDAHPEAALTLPASTLIFRSQGPQVAVVENNRISLRKIKIGRDFGSIIEVLSGVTAADQVVTVPSDSFADGIEVRVAEPAKTTAQNAEAAK